jgi:hypothetical protein
VNNSFQQTFTRVSISIVPIGEQEGAMSVEKPRTLQDEQIKVSASMSTAVDVLRNSKPYFESAVKSLGNSGSSKVVEVPSELLRDLVLLAAADIKRSEALLNARTLGEGGAVHDRGNSDWNPFNRVDFEFD